MSHHLLQATELGYTYPDGPTALSGISFRITHGESVAIVGSNGAGKSTLLQHLNGCLVPQKGTLRVGDVIVAESTLQTVRRTVGMVFQDPDDQLFMPNVYEDVAFGPANLGLPAEDIELRVMQALETTGVAHLRTRAPYHLSGGEKRAVAIATVLAVWPDILVLDEPSSALDPRARRRLLELLKTFDHTKVVATHDLDFALELCERTIILSRGNVHADGPTKELLAHSEILRAAELEPPVSAQGCPMCGWRKSND